MVEKTGKRVRVLQHLILASTQSQYIHEGPHKSQSRRILFFRRAEYRKATVPSGVYQDPMRVPLDRAPNRFVESVAIWIGDGIGSASRSSSSIMDSLSKPQLQV